MDVKYRELPEFKSADEFKIGDKVRHYFWNTNSKFYESEDKVIEIEGDLLMLLPTYSPVTFPPGRAHFKQCRKLEEVKPREWKFCAEHKTSYLHCKEGRHPIHCEFIQVREVL